MDMKNELYSVLNEFGKENIQIEFQNNINSSIPKIKEILSKTIATIYEKKEKSLIPIPIILKNHYLYYANLFYIFY